MPRLPLAPPPLPDEAISSWIARIAARYDLSTDALVQNLLPNETDNAEMARRIDVCACKPLEDTLAVVAGVPIASFARQRLAGLAANPHTAWPRRNPVWCPLCAAQDVAAFKEVYFRQEWGFGGYLMCSQHRCLLIASCPICLHQVEHRPLNGRLRLWCQHCEKCADAALPSRLTPFWPYGTPQQHRRCITIRLSNEDAVSLLLQVQSDLLAALDGTWPRTAWARGLKRHGLFSILRALSFVMLGPLWEHAYRFLPRYGGFAPAWSLPDDWTPGSLPPEVAAPALLASVTFLAAENRVRLHGVTWNPRLLFPGESDLIRAETLVWHLSATDAEWVRRLFGSPVVRPFALLLAALRSNLCGRGAMREGARRRQGAGGAERRIRESEWRRGAETAEARVARQRSEQEKPPAERFAISRFIEGYPSSSRPRLSRAQVEAPFAVYAALGLDSPADVVPPDFDGTLLGDRYIRLWLARHKHLPAQALTATLVAALETARSRACGLVLPELSATTPATPATSAMTR